jgi:hypothetical protein
MTSAIGIAILVVAGIWLFGSLLARWAGALLVAAGSVGLASTGDANGLLLVHLALRYGWLGICSIGRVAASGSMLAERACLVATAIWRSTTGRQPGKMQR